MSTLMHPQSFQSSELSRNPKAVFDAVEHGAVSITRRDGSPLLLMRQDDADGRDRLLALAGQLIAASLAGPDHFASHLADRFPWMLALSETEREQCAQEVLTAARASFDTQQPHLAIAELTAWQGTAEAIAAGLGGETVEWLDEDVPVERP
ncbi:prevent-host-death protein [Demequina sp.]|uniref:prevent-host-death protein n=1 Tax=Demequina sp. TaxID=2050685 RepID=UPI0025C5C9AB|nr:prevent-host-death protein [Demequina sp.]